MIDVFLRFLKYYFQWIVLAASEVVMSEISEKELIASRDAVTGKGCDFLRTPVRIDTTRF